KKLTVKGDLVHSGGILSIYEGQLIVDGDYRIQSKSISSNGTVSYGASSGRLQMTKASDDVQVGGHFITHATLSHEGYLTAGILKINGDFTQKQYMNSYGFYGSGTHKVVLSGASLQTVTFESAASRFNILEITNESEAGVKFTSPLNAVTFRDNGNKVTFANDDLLGWTLTEDEIYSGDLHLAGSVLNLAGHKLTVQGNLIHSGGTIEINGGELIVTGDYRVQSKKVSANGTVTYDYSNGYLKMVHDADVVEVGGQFVMQSQYSHTGLLTAGTMDVKGNFTQVNRGVSDNFRAQGTHKMIFSGNQLQTIQIGGGSNSSFNRLEITNTSATGVRFASAVYINKEVLPTTTPLVDGHNLILMTNASIPWASWPTSLGLDGNRSLQQDLTIDGDLYIYGGTINLNGKKLTVKGDLVHSGGILSIYEGQLIVDGDYRIQSKSIS
ncbi:hypothetical protein, partial [Acinetobacter baumannii]|uniref:hypothetical protein n=1 Tax=Acinetobacter baumannii TaxID=470 RepID=UPI002B2245FB